jgi:hypothetical protein
MRTLTTGITAGTMLFALGGLAAPVAAEAASCSSTTTGGSDSVGYTGKNGGNSVNGYTCAYRYSSGKIKLKPWQTKSWTSNSAPGYFKRGHCYKDEKNVQVSNAYAQTSTGSSFTQTATNWDTGNNRHFGGGVLWNTADILGNQFNTGKCNWGDFPLNLYWPTTLTATLVGSDPAAKKLTFQVSAKAKGNDPVVGGVGIYRQLGASPDPGKYDANGNVIGGTDPILGKATLASGNATVIANWPGSGQYYAAYSGTDVNSVPPVRGWTPALSTTIGIGAPQAASATPLTQAPRSFMAVVEKTTKAPKLPIVRCPVDWRVLQVEVLSPTVALDEADLVVAKRRAAVDRDGFKDGTRLTLQAVCVSARATVQKFPKLGLGTVGADTLKMAEARGVLMAGPGNDRLTLDAKRATGLGGLGQDSITVNAPSAVANGGPGADTLTSTTGPKQHGALLIGGPGDDKLTGGRGPDRLNALDGSGGDEVRCQGTANRVLADKGDYVSGACDSVKRR